ncbi:putative B3 domain-containing protein Os04g0347400 isoform X2 [Salvia miltiorrhiza]|uniref:putative B3 domain-containing protein Os04g0347400 isoform X2 n=1 Tax=Salvia miltiorrhiza TaxID=226208 RepID=UPI0025ABB8F5|nr:putative B3 domain-containing protein Os04g0347400 isoform X2 [Salvia miltiorrhiza]
MKRSRRSHVAKSLPMEEELSFFKEFPPDSVAKMQGVLGSRVTLRDAHKKLWTVEVERGENGFYFDKGWPQFYLENDLEPNDVVAFEYKHGELLDFRLFGRDACQKFGVKEDAEDEDEDEDEDYEVVCMSKNKAKSNKGLSSIHTSSKRRVEEEEIEMKMKESKSRSSPSSSSLRHDINDYYGHDIFGSGRAIRPKNPYFVSRSRKSRKNELHIPNHLIEEGKLKIESRMLMEDASGRRWESMIKKWKDGRVWCTRGWKRLCDANGIGPDDICICEFVQQDARTLCMLVRVVDVVK